MFCKIIYRNRPLTYGGAVFRHAGRRRGAHCRLEPPTREAVQLQIARAGVTCLGRVTINVRNLRATGLAKNARASRRQLISGASERSPRDGARLLPSGVVGVTPDTPQIEVACKRFGRVAVELSDLADRAQCRLRELER